eukprot:TRINITY_DN11085_c0_g1_i11.p1 TRINITY_DN11085_c0_g1~~TRINITY_DN11085_c0_g1_i11.p1  ORF type:complete len:245 (-),score=12.12 TRINITY_DN11085_c0_g1_i11:410-1144(-)
MCIRDRFDTQIHPVALYGAELWGLDKAAIHIEKVHLYALKKFLGVHSKTPNDLVYGETGRHPIYIESHVRCIRYWLNILRMDENRLPFKAYKMLYNLDSCGKYTWVTNVREILFRNGFGIVWVNQGVEDLKGFLKELRQRFIDSRWQNWDDHMLQSDRFSWYRTFKSSTNIENYLLLDIDRHLKRNLTIFRLGVTDIAVHRNRYKELPDNHLMCPLCKDAKEDETHVLLCCPAFNLSLSLSLFV